MREFLRIGVRARSLETSTAKRISGKLVGAFAVWDYHDDICAGAMVPYCALDFLFVVLACNSADA